MMVEADFEEEELMRAVSQSFPNAAPPSGGRHLSNEAAPELDGGDARTRKIHK